MTSPLRAEVYRALKQHGPTTARSLALYVKAPLLDVQRVVDSQITANFLGVVPKTQQIYILRPMGDPVPLQSIGSVLNTLTESPLILQDEVPIHLSYLNPLAHYVPVLQQGSPPSCVGHSFAEITMLAHMAATGQVPNITDKICRDVVSMEGGFTYDKLYRPCPSPWWIYQAARIEGHFSGYGARASDAADILQRIGYVPWDYCLTPKTTPRNLFYPRHGPDMDTYEYLKNIASVHKLKGSGIAKGSENIYSLIERWGACAIDITCFPSITRTGTDGSIRMPSENEEDNPIGLHNISLIGFNRTEKRFTYMNHWRGLAPIGTIPAPYLDKYGGVALSVSCLPGAPFSEPGETAAHQEITQNTANSSISDFLRGLKSKIEGKK